MSGADWLRFLRRAGVVIGAAFAVAFLPSTAWAAGEPSPVSTTEPAPSTSPTETGKATETASDPVTVTETATATETQTATATATETVTATPTGPAEPVPLDEDQFTVLALIGALVTVSVGVVAGAVVARG